MRNRVGYTIIGILLGVSSLTAACSDDEDGTGPGMGGESSAGESSGGSSSGKGGSSNGGSSSGSSNGGSNSGSSNGGSANDAGAGGAVDGGSGGMGGESVGGEGGSAGGGGAGGDMAEGGAAGAGGAGVTYACGSSTIERKACSALAALSCDIPLDCSECLPRTQEEREPYALCAPCLAEIDKFYQCAIDAHESGNFSEGLVCFDDPSDPEDPSIPDYADVCYEFFFSASQCLDYEAAEEECPATWPLTP